MKKMILRISVVSSFFQMEKFSCLNWQMQSSVVSTKGKTLQENIKLSVYKLLLWETRWPSG